MFGAIVGDIAGSTFERFNFKFESCAMFPAGSRFTDDTVLTLATAECLVSGGSYRDAYRGFGRAYPNAGYGSSFHRWMQSEDMEPYNSLGNGSAMRVSPIAWAAKNLDWALDEAARSASVTHDHPDGIAGAQAVAAAIFLARRGQRKSEIREGIIQRFGYDLNRKLSSIRPSYIFNATCKGSVPEAIIAFLESEDFEDALRKAISLGGDSDTIASITCAIAHAFYGEVPKWMVQVCLGFLDPDQVLIISDFWSKYSQE